MILKPVQTLGEKFQPDLGKFPVNLEGLFLPRGWNETKWTRQSVFVWTSAGEILELPIKTLVESYAGWVGGDTYDIAGIELINEQNGRQLFFGVNPESKPGNEFSGIIYVERGLGGATNIPYAQFPDGTTAAGLMYQHRPLLFQGGLVLQVMGGYSIQVDGSIAAIHAATVASEMDEMGEFKGKFRVKREDVRTIGARYNVNKAMNLTGTVDGVEGGISVQATRLPHEILVPNGDGTWHIDRDLVALDGNDRTLEGITKETFFPLSRELINAVRDPSNGAPSCIHTETAVSRLFDAIHFNEWGDEAA